MAPASQKAARASPANLVRLADASGLAAFSFTVPRRKIVLDEVITGATWEDLGVAANLAELAIRQASSLQLLEGDIVACSAVLGGERLPIWRMRVSQVGDIDVASSEATISLASEAAFLNASQYDFHFNADRTHPKGWDARQITIAVCERLDIPVQLPLPRATYKQKGVKSLASDGEGNPINVITGAWKREAERNGRRFALTMELGVLQIREITGRQRPVPFAFGASMQSATYTKTGLSRRSKFATVVTVHNTTKGKTPVRQQVTVRHPSKFVRRRYGLIHKDLHVTEHKTRAQLRAIGLRYLNALPVAPRRSITFTHPGVIGLRRGDIINVRVPEENISGQALVMSCAHTLAPGSYTVEVSAQFDAKPQVYAAQKVALAGGLIGPKAEQHKKATKPKKAKPKTKGS
jgi:hypothetical protein